MTKHNTPIEVEKRMMADSNTAQSTPVALRTTPLEAAVATTRETVDWLNARAVKCAVEFDRPELALIYVGRAVALGVLLEALSVRLADEGLAPETGDAR